MFESLIQILIAQSIYHLFELQYYIFNIYQLWILNLTISYKSKKSSIYIKNYVINYRLKNKIQYNNIYIYFEK